MCMSMSVWWGVGGWDQGVLPSFTSALLPKRQLTFGRRLDKLWHVICVQIVIQNTFYFIFVYYRFKLFLQYVIQILNFSFSLELG